MATHFVGNVMLIQESRTQDESFDRLKMQKVVTIISKERLLNRKSRQRRFVFFPGESYQFEMIKILLI